MQKRRARTREAGDEDRPLDLPFEDLGGAQLFVTQPEQIGQKAADIPVCPEPAK